MGKLEELLRPFCKDIDNLMASGKGQDFLTLRRFGTAGPSRWGFEGFQQNAIRWYAMAATGKITEDYAARHICWELEQYVRERASVVASDCWLYLQHKAWKKELAEAYRSGDGKEVGKCLQVLKDYYPEKHEEVLFGDDSKAIFDKVNSGKWSIESMCSLAAESAANEEAERQAKIFAC